MVLGAGGHARVIIEALRLSGAALPVAILDADARLWDSSVLGIPVRGGDDLLPELAAEGVNGFVVGVGGIGDNRPRARLFELARKHGLEALTVRHPSAVCSSEATLGLGSVLCPCAVVNVGATLGFNVVVNSGAIVEHDCVLGDHVHIATGARLGGAVTAGRLSHIGIGAAVRQGVSIGEGAVVGAGAAVVKDVEAWTVVTGVPAKVLRRRLSPTHRQRP